MEHVVLWLKFLVAAGIIVAAGLRLTRVAERLAAAMGWGHAFAGFIVLGWATSLPEVTISVSAVGAVDSPALAAGNITGSVIFNLAILALLDLLAGRDRSRIDTGAHGVSALGVFNLVMLGGTLLVALVPGLLAGRGALGLGLFLVVVYVLSSGHCWWTQPETEADAAPPAPPGTRRRLLLACALAGGVILLAGMWLAVIGDELAATYDLQAGFVGTLFLAGVSSLPELVTGLAAVRLGLLTMAAASILGSNIFNLGILGVCDLVYQSGREVPPLLQSAGDPRLTYNLAAGLVMTLLALIVLRLRSRSASALQLSSVSYLMLALYAAALATT